MILGSFSIYHSDQSFPLISLSLRSFCVLYILWHIKWFVDVTLIENVKPSKFHNRQNKVRVKKKRFSITSLLLPNYHDYKKDINEKENSSNCFPNDLITLAAFSICE